MIPRQHSVRFYDDDVFLTEAIASFIKLGLQVNDTLIVRVPASRRTDLRRLLTPDELSNNHLMFCDPTSLLSNLWAEAKYRAVIRLEELRNTLQTTHPFSRLHAYPHSAFTSKEDPPSLLAGSQAPPHVHHQNTGTSPPRNRYMVAAVVSLPSSLYIGTPRLLLCFARVASRRFAPHDLE